MKKCKNCKEGFEPRFSTLEKYCWNPDCKTIEGLLKLEKLKKKDQAKNRKRTKELKQELETIQQKVLRVQRVVNTFVRLRDQGKKCISCTTILKGKFDAGHYYNANQHWNIRFDLKNINGQCVKCNQYLSGNLIFYRFGLIGRIGSKEVIRLDQEAKKIRKFTKFELEEILQEFKFMIKNYN